MSDFFDGNSGLEPSLRRRDFPARRLLDAAFDASLRISALARVRRAAAARPARRVLIVGVEVPSRPNDIHDVVAKLRRRTRHHTTVRIHPMGDRGKFANIDCAIRADGDPLESFDWLLIVDDDIAFAPRFLDDFIALAEAADLAMAQPAHAFASHASYTITRRVMGSLVRRTAFVEIGPLTLIRADAFATFVPFPESRWCYGIDLLWSELADARRMRIGIVDATPVRHLRGIAHAYPMDAAVLEGRELVRRYNLKRRREDLWMAHVVIPLRERAPRSASPPMSLQNE